MKLANANVVAWCVLAVVSVTYSSGCAAKTQGNPEHCTELREWWARHEVAREAAFVEPNFSDLWERYIYLETYCMGVNDFRDDPRDDPVEP